MSGEAKREVQTWNERRLAAPSKVRSRGITTKVTVGVRIGKEPDMTTMKLFSEVWSNTHERGCPRLCYTRAGLVRVPASVRLTTCGRRYDSIHGSRSALSLELR